jgi:hypothetical protein
MFWPVSIVIAGAIVVALFLFGSEPVSQSQRTTALSTGVFAYPDNNQNVVPANDPYPDEDATPTSRRTASPTPRDSDGRDEDEDQTTVRNATSTPRSSTTPGTSTIDDESPDASPTRTATDEPEDPTDSGSDFGPVVATETSTPTMTPEPDSMECPAEAVTEIAGQGPPNTPLVLYFGDRPVGGGTTNSEGFYSIPLKIVHERTNETYQVEVRIRDNHKVIRTVTCIVPDPTPIP